MFCEDSRGSDIDHFWPLAHYQERTFVWLNLLFACAECNRVKGDQFALDATGRPLLIDPTAEDPWDYLFYDSRTGNLTARFEPTTKREHPKGKHTTDASVLPLNIEPVTEGRRRIQRNLRRAVERCLEQLTQGADSAAAAKQLQTAVQDNDDYGLAVWFFLREGREEAPFRTLRSKNRTVWRAITDALQE
ncbi:MAG: hypothetical protein L0Z62_28985 [Gemmataceae bacterium]|nr:hypothetical protein [Gemmataceae bacterium]